MVDASAGDLVAVDEESGGAAFAEAASVIGEVHADGGFAGGEGAGSGDLVGDEAEEVVAEGWLAVFEVEAPAAEAAALREDDAVGAALRDVQVCGDGEGAVLDVDEDVLAHAGHALAERERGAACHQIGAADESGVEALETAVVDGQDAVLDRLLDEEVLHLLELGGIGGGEIVGEAEVVAGVVELPFVVLQRGTGLGFPGRAVDGAGEPAVAVDGTVAGDLEVLGFARALCLGAFEGVEHADAFDGLLLDAVDGGWFGQVGGFEYGGRDIDDVVPLRADFVGCGDVFGPGDDQADCACRRSWRESAWST